MRCFVNTIIISVIRPLVYIDAFVPFGEKGKFFQSKFISKNHLIDEKNLMRKKRQFFDEKKTAVEENALKNNETGDNWVLKFEIYYMDF